MAPDQGKSYAESLLEGYRNQYKSASQDERSPAKPKSLRPVLDWQSATNQVAAACRLKKRLEGGG